jgi:hypothetical protein
VLLTDILPDFGSGWTAEVTGGDVIVACLGGGNTFLCGIFQEGPEGTVFVGIEMGPGQFYTVRITSPNNEGGCGTVTNTATVAADNASEISDSGSVTVICPPQ